MGTKKVENAVLVPVPGIGPKSVLVQQSIRCYRLLGVPSTKYQ
jgi:hypothetical protein